MNRLWTACVLLALAPAARADDWPQWLGPRRDSGSAEKVAPWTEAPKALWRAPVGAGFSSPVVAGGRVFVHARVPREDREEVVALDAATGKILWRTGYDRGAYRSVLNPGPRATPTVAGNRVYAFGITGVLTALDADSGKTLWQVDTFKKLKATLPRYGVCCSPLVVGNRVLVAVGGKGSSVAAFDADTGEVQWQGLDEPASTSSPVLFAVGGSQRGTPPDVVFMTTLRLVGLNPLDGSVSWEFPLPFQPSGTAPTPITAGDLLVTSTMTNGTTAVRVTGGDKPAAGQVWQGKDLHGYFSTGLAVRTDYLFLVTNTLQPTPQADLCCVELKTGKVLWTQEKVGYFHFGVVRTGDDKLLILDDAGTLKLIEPDPKGYRELCRAKVCGGTLVTPALAGGRLYARDDKEVVCLQLTP
jgi:outer membrane protein assembly factor BamB